MIRIEPALVVGLLPHGEHGVVARFLDASSGLVAAYVHGGRGRALRAVLQLGNQVALELTPRRAGQLPVAAVHPLASNMAMLHGPAAMAVVEHVAGLAA
ncbi:recombination protein O N-terminal domain-containing protein, partial [Sandarakinorhabdus rubra]|uniref:recombination protein O N-terminal domain-containing protein n=1 Tax=Sandarakinorhabdus rubra TaxID=2672568 RepID=UPI00196A160F